VLLEDQGRTLWNHAQIQEGLSLAEAEEISSFQTQGPELPLCEEVGIEHQAE